MANQIFICDKDLARILGVSQSTITRIANGVCHSSSKVNSLSDVKPVYVGGARRWNAKSVAEALGISVEEITN